MADTAARLALIARRYQVCRFTIVVTGIDFTGVAMNMRVRLQRGTPGAPAIALGTVTTASAEGPKLDNASIINGVPVSVIKGWINQSTMSDASKVPFVGELGAEPPLTFNMQWTLNGDANDRIEGEFIVRDSAFGSDNAPANRPESYRSGRTVHGSNASTLTFGDQVTNVSIDGTDVTAPKAVRVEAASAAAQGYATTATAAGITLVDVTALNGNSITVGTPSGGFIDGRLYRLTSPITSTGAVTINDRPLLGPDGNPVSTAGALSSGGDVIFRYRLTGVVFFLVSAANQRVDVVESTLAPLPAQMTKNTATILLTRDPWAMLYAKIARGMSAPSATPPASAPLPRRRW